MSKKKNSIFYRVSPILFSIIGMALSHNLFFLVLPLQMKSAGLNSSQVGIAMGMFAAGSIAAGLFGSKLVNRVGHIRAFASFAATLSIVSIAHSFMDSFFVISALRVIAGFCFIASFITLESWLNVMSDSSNRGKLFSVYQIFFALGFGAAPFLMSQTGESDIRLYGVISALTAVALIIMAMSRMPQPELPGRSRAMSLKKLWGYSPSGTFSCVIAGSIGSASVSLIALYAYARGFHGPLLSVILGSYLLGGLLTQYPTGWFADRFDKRTVGAALMLVGIGSNAIIILDYFENLPTSIVVLFFLLSGGAGAAIFPLAVTQVFDHIETKEALPATSTMQILLGVGGVLGPIIAGALMTAFSEIWLYFYVIVLHVILMAFLLIRKLFIRTERLEPAQPYQMTTNPASVPPLEEYVKAEIAEPALKLLIEALKQTPKNPQALIKVTLESAKLQAEDVALQMVLKLPKYAGELTEHLVTLYPEKRLEVARSLTDFFDLHKTRINYAIVGGLKTNATDKEIFEIDRLIELRKQRLKEVGLPCRMRTLYPEIAPFNHSFFETEDGHKIYFEQCGNPHGEPVIFIHGGPGGGCSSEHRRFFNPEHYRIILFDQRGCGRSLPHGSLSNNTTQALISDMEQLRNLLNIDKWLLFGGSWGSTLSLAYAQRHTERVSGMILRGIFLCRPRDLEWFYQDGASHVYPDYWQDYIEPIDPQSRDNMMQAYYQILTGPDEIKRMHAAKAWSVWEGRCSTLAPSPSLVDHFEDPHVALAMARIEAHYFVNNAFFSEDQLLKECNKLVNLPTWIVHGRYDMVCPIEQAYLLSKQLPHAQFEIVRDAGHSAFEPGITDRLIHATDQFLELSA